MYYIYVQLVLTGRTWVGAFPFVFCDTDTKEQANKIQNMNANEINDLALELEDDKSKKSYDKEAAKSKELQKKKIQVQQRLAAEKKKAAKQQPKRSGGKNKNDDEDDETDLTTFVKGGKKK